MHPGRSTSQIGTMGTEDYRRSVVSTNRAAILAAATASFLGAGYDRSTMAAIATDAGVSLRTLYKHFSTKDALFGGVVDGLSESLVFEVEPGGGDIEAVLTDYARRYGAVLLRPLTVAVFRMLVAEGPRFPELRARFLRHAKQPVGGGLRAWLGSETAAGRLRADDLDACVGQFFGMLDHDLLWPALLGDSAPLGPTERDAAAERTVRALLARYGAPRG